MKLQFATYLNQLGASAIVSSRVEEFLEEFANATATACETLFISETIDDSGLRSYVDIWAFNAHYISQGKNFLVDKNIDFVSSSVGQEWIELNYLEYSLSEDYNDASRLRVISRFGSISSMELFASRNNCLKLLEVARSYLFGPTRLRKVQAAAK